ncbi:MAG TPA: hypothetical protein VHJ20_09750 [Polyangia bacterium]|nr:hypothetical protein [Polyangia bacterium]
MIPLVAAVAAAAVAWVVDDGEKVPRDIPLPEPLAEIANGHDNPIWSPGQPIRLFALRDEVVAFQVVLEGPLDGARVDVEALDPAFTVERFVEPFFDVPRSKTENGPFSLGWQAHAGPKGDAWTGWWPDALVPVELAKDWAPFPLRVPARQNGVVWIDLTVPPDAAPGVRRAQVVVRVGEQVAATLPLELEVLPATMPARPVRTWIFYERGELEKRIGHPDVAAAQLLQLLHRHRLTGFDGVGSAADVEARASALDGSLYTPAHGYHGPAEGVGDDLVVLGTYGTLFNPRPESIARVEGVADALAKHNLFEGREVLIYAADENCRAPVAAAWRATIAQSTNANVRRVRVGWTCSEDPSTQPVDVAMVHAGEYDPRLAGSKPTWIYNGYRPSTGALLTDTEATSMRTFGWIASMAKIQRWFVWESTAWYDSNWGGHGAYDPFVSAATGYNDDEQKILAGDGVLLYPGKQIDKFQEHSLGLDGVVPSIRLKNLRRGVEDAGYYELAAASDPAAAAAIARALLPRILGEAKPEERPPWGERGAPFFEARRALSKLIRPGATITAMGVDALPAALPTFGNGPHAKKFHIRYRQMAVGVFVLGVLGFAWFLRRRFRAGRAT